MRLEFKKPDLNAPRHKSTFMNVLSKEFFKEFRMKYPQHSAYSDEELKKFVGECNKKAWEIVVEERDGMELMEGLGYIFLGTCSPAKNFNTDYGKSIANGLRVKAHNWESDNFLMKIFYSNFSSRYKFRNREIWHFVGCREFKRSASVAYRENWKKYVRVEDRKRVNEMFKRIVKRNIILEKTSIIPDKYNEFDFK